MKNKNSTEALIKALNLNTSAREKPSDEWKTAWDLAEASNRSLSHTSKKIREGLHAGTVETKTFRVERDGIFRCVPHYKIKEKAFRRPRKRVGLGN